mmetsp:Transcript_24758/g.56708  ORF Transcript_24758/g.56708 Transcript_24758/m.56708 type:complete len:83 (-) Transcript_24758:37-285(-)
MSDDDLITMIAQSAFHPIPSQPSPENCMFGHDQGYPRRHHHSNERSKRDGAFLSNKAQGKCQVRRRASPARNPLALSSSNCE